MSGVYPSDASDVSSASLPESSSSYDHHWRDTPRAQRPRGSSVHTAAALDVVDAGRRSVRTPGMRSVRYSDRIDAMSSPDAYPAQRPRSGRPVSARPGTAASAVALAGVVPTGGDRLKDLQLHMEQLQQLYAQEVHKEELSRREAFVQSMCTASITLWRYVCSKPRFFTAVKALLTQYLPASDARLYEIETSAATGGGLTLVLADGRAIAVQGSSDSMGIVGRAVHATSQLTAAQWTGIQKNVDQQVGEEDAANDDTLPARLSCSSSSSLSSSARSSSTGADAVAPATNPRWLERHADCVLPSTNHNMFLALPLDRVYRDSGFDPEIDLTIKKRDLFQGSTAKQLLVVVLRDAEDRPVGAIEALVTTKKPIQIDFLDAFASLLAAALEARRSICRPTTGPGLTVQIVHEGDSSHCTSPESEAGNTNEIESVALSIAPGVKMVVAGGGVNAKSAESDLPLLDAVQKPMAELHAQMQRWQRHALSLEARAAAERTFWSRIVASVIGSGSGVDEVADSCQRGFRSDLREAIGNLGEGSVRFKVLFEGETLEQFAAIKTEEHEKLSLSVEGQFAALQRTICTGEDFASTPFVTAVSITAGGQKAALLMLVEGVAMDDEEDFEDEKIRTLSRVSKAVELSLWTEACENERAAIRVEADLLREVLQQAESLTTERDVVLGLGERLAGCETVEEIVVEVQRLSDAQDTALQKAHVTLFVAEYTDDEDSQDATDAAVHSIWTARNDIDGRVVIYERDSVTSPNHGTVGARKRQGGGMAVCVLESGAPLTYTQRHPSFDFEMRVRIQRSESPASADTERFYYAMPLNVHGTSRVLGVLEFAFETDQDQKAFATSALARSVGSTVETFLDLRRRMSSVLKQQARLLDDMKIENGALWTRWRSWMAMQCDASESEMTAWKSAAQAQLLKLIPRASHVNVLVTGDGFDLAKCDDELMTVISSELDASEQRTSPSLNVRNHALLRSVSTFPLGGFGLLVVAKESSAREQEDDDKEFAAQVDQFGALAASLLTCQLRHLDAKQQDVQEIRLLRDCLSEKEKQLSIAQDARAMLTRRAVQTSVLVGVQHLMDDISGQDTEDTMMLKITHALVDQAVASNSAEVGTTRLHASVALSVDDGEDSWIAWSSDSKAAQRLSTRASHLLTSCVTTTACSPPFLGSQIDLLLELGAPRVQVNETNQLVIVVLPIPTQGGKRACRLVLVVDDEESEMDDTFVADLARVVSRVLAGYFGKRYHLAIQAELDDTASALDLVRSELDISNKSQDKWAAVRRIVFGRLRTLDSADLDVLKATREELLRAVQTHVESEVSTVLSGRNERHEPTTRIAVRQGEHESLLDTVVGEWISPAERVGFVSSLRRESSDVGLRLEFYGALALKVLAVVWKDTKEDCLSTGAVAVRLHDEMEQPSSPKLVQTKVERVLAEAMGLVVVVVSVLALYQRIREGALESTRLTQLLEDQASRVSELTVDSTRKGQVGQLLMTLQTVEQGAASSECVVRVVNDVPGLCLWVCDRDEATVWTIQPDDSKRTRAYDPTTWKTSPSIVKIQVDGRCLGVLEWTDTTSPCDGEMELVASMVQGALLRRQLQEQLEDVHTKTQRETQEAALKLEQDEARRSDIVQHWHAVDMVLRSSLSTSGSSGEDDLWARAMVQVERDIVETFPQVEAVRIVFFELDVERHRVVMPETVQLSPACQHIVSQLELWTTDHLEIARTKTIPAVPDAATSPLQSLFPTKCSPASDVVLAAVPVADASASSQAVHLFAVIVALARSSSGAIAADVVRALQVDLRLAATAQVWYKEHDAARRRAVEAEMSLVAVKQQHEEAHQWIAFLQSAQHQVEQLVRLTVEASRDSCSNESLWSVITPQIENFIQTVCACEAVDMYDVVTSSGDDTHRLLVPLTTRGASLSPSGRSRAFAQSLDRLVNDTIDETLAVESTPSGRRLVVAVHNACSSRVVGVVVIHWSETNTVVADSVVEIVDTVVRPWLATVFAVVHDAESQRISLDASTLQIHSLEREKSELEMQGLEMKSHLMQAEQRNASLQTTLQVTGEMLEELQKRITATPVDMHEPRALWTSLVDEIASVKGVHGVLLLESSEGREPTVMRSTLSDAEGASVRKAIQPLDDSSSAVRRSLPPAHEIRVLIQSEYKRVRVVWLPGDDPIIRCMVIVFASDKRTSHQQLALVDRFVEICVALTATKGAEMERVELQAAAAGALEAATQDLTMQLSATSERLTKAHARLHWWEALHFELAHDLSSHEVWRPSEKPTQHAVAIATGKLTKMCRFLQDTAHQRLLRALADTATVSVQLYGVVHAAGSKSGGFIFSLPSHDSAAKSFFCVALDQLEQRREWRKMVQSVRSGKQVPAGVALVDGTMLFPVRRHRPVMPGGKSELALDENHSDDDEEHDVGREQHHDVVGILLVKLKGVPATVGDLEVASLVQELADTMASRVDWIGSIVANKQRVGNHRQPAPPGRLADNGRVHSNAALGMAVHDAAEAQQHVVRECDIGTTHLVNPNAMVDSVRQSEEVTPIYDSQLSRAASGQSVAAPVLPDPASHVAAVPHDNQIDFDLRATDGDCADDADSDEEREAERRRDRLQTAVTSGVLDFVLRVQALDADDGSDDAALRLLVAREWKSVWCARGDTRKHLLGTCELFFGENGVVRDALSSSSTSAAPPWVHDAAARTWKLAQTDISDFRLHKIDARHWIALKRLSSSSFVLVALSGSTTLATVFDAADERVHVPLLLRGIAAHSSQLLRAQARATAQRDLASAEATEAAQRNAEWRSQRDEWQRRATLEEELSVVSATLIQATDERALIQEALAMMQRVLRCDHVAYHAATASSVAVIKARASEERDDEYHGGVAMETLIRVRVLAASQGDDTDRELLGTMVARLTEETRSHVNASAGADAKAWAMRLLQRLADATALAISGLRQRILLRRAEATLASASSGLETQSRELLACQGENQELLIRVDALTREVEQQRELEDDNTALREQLERVRDELAMSTRARDAMASQLAQCERQLVEVNGQLEQSLRVETQLMQLEHVHAVSQAREARLERKNLKLKLQLKHAVAELAARRDTNERDQLELAELRRHVAVLTEKQQHQGGGGMDASSVATAVMQAQAQAMAQSQAIQQHQSQTALRHRAQQQCAHVALQRRLVRQLQLQQHAQKRKQLGLAHELRQLAALEVEEMTRRTQRPPTVAVRKVSHEDSGSVVHKVHDVRLATAPARPPPSRLRAPRIVLGDHQRRASHGSGNDKAREQVN